MDSVAATIVFDDCHGVGEAVKRVEGFGCAVVRAQEEPDGTHTVTIKKVSLEAQRALSIAVLRNELAFYPSE